MSIPGKGHWLAGERQQLADWHALHQCGKRAPAKSLKRLKSPARNIHSGIRTSKQEETRIRGRSQVDAG